MNKSKTEQKVLPPSIVAGATVFFAGACVMMVELAAGRLVAYHFGSSLYTWTGVIGVTLAGLTTGNYLGGRLADYSPTKRTIGGLFGVASITCVGSIWLNNSLEKWAIFGGLSWPLYSLACITVVFLLTPVFIGAIIPVAAKTALDQQQEKGNTIGKVYAFGSAGSIAGTLIAGFWLIPAIGSNGVIWATAAALLAAGLLYDLKYRLLYPWAGILVIMIFLGSTKSQYFEQTGATLSLRSKPDPNVIYDNETQYCRVRISKKSDNPDVRVFIQDKLTHSIAAMGDITNLQYSYEKIYAAATEQAMKGHDNPAFLAIGGGGFVFPRYLKHMWPTGKVDVVEIDPGVTTAAIAAFGLQENHGLNIFTMDGRNFIDDVIAKEEVGKRIHSYDFIYGDAYDHFSVPYQLITKEFNEKVARLLKEDGFYMLNLIDVYDSGQVLGSVLNTLRQTFRNVYVLTLAFEYYGRMTFVLIASQKTLDIDSIAAEVSKSFPDIWRLSEEELDTLITRNKGITLTDDYAPIDNLAAPISVRDKAWKSASDDIIKASELGKAGEWERAVKLYMKVIYNCQPLSVNNYVDISNDLLAHHEFKKSFFVCQNGLQYYDRPEIKTDISTMHLCMGASLRGLRQPEKSQKYLNRAIEGFKHRLQITPTAPDVLANLGMALASTGNIAEAKIYLERAVKAAPYNPEYHFMLITVLIDQKDYEQAQTAITNAINAMKQGGNTEAVSRLQRIAEQAATRQSQTKQ